MTKPPSYLAYHLAEAAIRERAGDAAFHRGKVYFSDGHVFGLLAFGEGFKASVKGGETYTVAAWVEDDDLAYQCSCPVGVEGGFCKHLVAACLAWKSRNSGGDTKSTETIQQWLNKQPVAWLAETVLGQAMKDQRLFNRIHLAATRSHQPKALPDLRAEIDRATATRGFVDFDDSRGFVDGIHAVLGSFEDAIAMNAAGVMDLCVHALQRVKQAVEHVDDSDGELNGVIERIEMIHHRASEVAKPDPMKLAATLLELELHSEYGEFIDAAAKYADVLGEAGDDEYCRLARQEWARVPTLDAIRNDNDLESPDPDDPYPYRENIMRIMAAIARRKGDFDAQADVRARDLSTPDAYWELVEMAREREDYTQALAWARKGAAAFKGEGLGNLLAEELERAGKHDEAIKVIWTSFTQQPDMQAFLRLREFVKAPGEWLLWRDKVVGHVRGLLAAAHAGSEWEVPCKRALLVEMLIHEGDIDTALAEAKAGPCDWQALSRLAEACAPTVPVEALKIYERLVSDVLQHGSNRNYRYARDLMRRMALLCARRERNSDFEEYLAEVRADYKRKRNFMALLDRTKWP
ncbi:MAG: SWIM zinc finger family protein [Planctomycetes bacterium]|nr:SWIM zinc finger family protein [Planctomycetota bacterium]